MWRQKERKRSLTTTTCCFLRPQAQENKGLSFPRPPGLSYFLFVGQGDNFPSLAVTFVHPRGNEGFYTEQFPRMVSPRKNFVCTFHSESTAPCTYTYSSVRTAGFFRTPSRHAFSEQEEELPEPARRGRAEKDPQDAGDPCRQQQHRQPRRPAGTRRQPRQPRWRGGHRGGQGEATQLGSKL